MDWQGLSRQLLAEHQHEPQILGRLELAISMAKEALQIMGGHGHQFHLASGPGDWYPEWPKRLFHVDNAPNGILVLTEEDAVALGPGYFDSFQKAQFWDGMETQFNGRGGVAKSPRSLVPLLHCKPLSDPEETQRRLALIAAFRALNKWETPMGLSEAEKFDAQIKDFGNQGKEINMSPPSLQMGNSPLSEPGAVTSRDSETENA